MPAIHESKIDPKIETEVSFTWRKIPQADLDQLRLDDDGSVDNDVRS
jgi:hypothetical protein